MFIIALGLGWPELFKAFSRALPLAFRLLLAGFLALIVFMQSGLDSSLGMVPFFRKIVRETIRQHLAQ
jgi:hypothetical protein